MHQKPGDPKMSHVQATTLIPVDPDSLWRRAGSFQGVGDWHPMLAAVEGEGEEPGALRRAMGQDGREQVERLREINPRERFYRYEIVSTPMPVKDYVSELRVVDNHDGTSTVVWESDFRVDSKDELKTVALIKGFLDTGVEALRAESSTDRSR